MTRRKSRDERRREQIRDELWPDSDSWRWPPSDAAGWFKAPRALPVVLAVMGLKELTGDHNPSFVYIELLSRVREDGLVQLGNESDHAMMSGYGTPRGVRTWEGHVKRLADLGFIQVKERGTRALGYVMIVNPYVALQRLKNREQLPERWWALFVERWADSSAPVPGTQTTGGRVLPFAPPRGA